MGTSRFAQYYWSAITGPSGAFGNLIRDKNVLRFSAYAVSIPAVLYTLVYVFLIIGGGQPFKPWLDIPPDVYYQYNVFLCAPSMFAGWILAAGVVHTLSRIITTEGTFEQTLSVFAFGISIASWMTGAHDLVTSFFGAVHVISQRDYEIALNSPTVWRTLLWVMMAAYMIWFIILFSTGTKTVYGVKTWQAALLGITGFIVYQLFFFIVNR